MEELDNYPYTRKGKFIEPYFTPLDLSYNSDFEAAVTGLLLSGNDCNNWQVRIEFSARVWGDDQGGKLRGRSQRGFSPG